MSIDRLDIAEKYYLHGKRFPLTPPIKEYTAFFNPSKNEQSPPEPKEIPEKDIGNYIPQGEVEFISIQLPNNLLKDNAVIIDAPSLDVLLALKDDHILRHVLNAHAFLFVLDGLMNQVEKEHLTRLRHTTAAPIYFVQTKIDKFQEEWQEWRRRNIQIIAEVFGVPRTELIHHYFPVSSKFKNAADKMRKPTDTTESTSPKVASQLEAKSKFPRLCRFLKGTLNKTDAERKMLACRLLQQLRFETTTLHLQTNINQAELLKYKEWFDETYPPLKAHFKEASAAIYQETKDRLKLAFGSQGYKPIVMKLIESLSDTSAEQLRQDVKEIQQRCINECTKVVESILGAYIEQMDQLFNDVQEQLHLRLKTTGESTVSGLTIHLVEKLLPLPSGRGETLQSLMTPLTIISDAISAATVGDSTAPIKVGTGLASLVIWRIAQHYNSIDLEITNKAKRTEEIKNILEGIVTESAEQAARQLQTFIRTYNKKALKIFQNFEVAANEVLLNNNVSKNAVLEAHKGEVETLLTDIEKTLGKLEEN